MTRGFQIWYQKLNQTTFDPVFAKKKTVKTAFCQFSTVFMPKVVKCCSI